ncbi:MAG: thermonuclease family protein [Candidatus Omnitrophica bacterium]|nr:thermonuclease family protein [Candidatus Omnitrophota bacterium]MDE2008886.1 thermonuclease family protein [Candidatus Omnitrophota bacterium]MDE2213551.1 thermonuclease family protein [Candidatus Omnitrophota bacterium]MDE2230548.1 thermonuclease family protein [Candidatus Omnitrophota bacterium]
MIFRSLVIFLLLGAVCRADDNLFNYSNRTQEALVVKVVAPDLIVLEDGRRVKLIGIESLGTPPPPPVKYDAKGRVIELPQPPTIPLQEQAYVFARHLMENKKVKLEYDVDPGDTNGYTNAYVYLPDGRMANAVLLRMGFVKLSIVVPNVKYEGKLRAAYRQARQEKRGVQDE